jgi:hypothetical protein
LTLLLNEYLSSLLTPPCKKYTNVFKSQNKKGSLNEC